MSSLSADPSCPLSKALLCALFMVGFAVPLIALTAGTGSAAPRAQSAPQCEQGVFEGGFCAIYSDATPIDVSCPEGSQPGPGGCGIAFTANGQPCPEGALTAGDGNVCLTIVDPIIGGWVCNGGGELTNITPTAAQCVLLTDPIVTAEPTATAVVPTATSVPVVPTATSVPVVPTATSVPVVPTATSVPPTAVAVERPSATATPASTSSSVPVPASTPRAASAEPTSTLQLSFDLGLDSVLIDALELGTACDTEGRVQFQVVAIPVLPDAEVKIQWLLDGEPVGAVQGSGEFSDSVDGDGGTHLLALRVVEPEDWTGDTEQFEAPECDPEQPPPPCPADIDPADDDTPVVFGESLNSTKSNDKDIIIFGVDPGCFVAECPDIETDADLPTIAGVGVTSTKSNGGKGNPIIFGAVLGADGDASPCYLEPCADTDVDIGSVADGPLARTSSEGTEIVVTGAAGDDGAPCFAVSRDETGDSFPVGAALGGAGLLAAGAAWYRGRRPGGRGGGTQESVGINATKSNGGKGTPIIW